MITRLRKIALEQCSIYISFNKQCILVSILQKPLYLAYPNEPHLIVPSGRQLDGSSHRGAR